MLRSRGGHVVITLASVAVAASAAVLLAVASRVLSPPAFSALGLIWTLTVLFGYGLAAPTEQLLNRRANVEAASSSRGPMRLLVGMASVFLLLATMTVYLRDDAWATAVVFGLFLAVAGWTVVAWGRSRLLASGDFRAYAYSLWAETLTRCCLLAAAALWPPYRWPLLVCAVGVPLLISGATSFLFVAPRSVGCRPPEGKFLVSQVGFILTGLGYQVCLNGPPFLVQLMADPANAALAGAFLVANSLLRAPSVLASGVLTHELTNLSAAWREGCAITFTRQLRRSHKAAFLPVVASTGGVLVFSSHLMSLFYGGPGRLEHMMFLALAASTVATVTAGVLVTAVLASGRAREAALCWAGGAAITVVTLHQTSLQSHVFPAALVLAPVATILCALWTLKPNRAVLAVRSLDTIRNR